MPTLFFVLVSVDETTPPNLPLAVTSETTKVILVKGRDFPSVLKRDS